MYINLELLNTNIAIYVVNAIYYHKALPMACLTQLQSLHIHAVWRQGIQPKFALDDKVDRVIQGLL